MVDTICRCYTPHKDVLVPPNLQTPRKRRGAQDPERNATVNLLHGGGIWGWKNNGKRRISPYSLGMRQAIYERFGDARGEPHGLRVVNHSIADSEWLSAKFCLAAAQRQVAAKAGQ